MNDTSPRLSASRARVARLFARIARVLGRVESRLFLSTAIIVSLLPFGWVERLDGLFLGIFAIEFALRASLVFRGEPNSPPASFGASDERSEWQWPKPTTLLLLLFDLVALLSFVPGLIGVEADDARWLRLFRLSRMLLLLSYWAPLVRDVWSVMLKRERAKQVVLMGFIVLALSFAGAVVIDQLRVINNDVVDFDGDGLAGYDESGQARDVDDERFYVHIWWAFRQIQDPGNMLESPEQAAAVVVSLALTTVGLFMVSFLIGLGTDVVRELMDLAQLRPPGLRGHTIVVNIDVSTQQLLHELIRYSRKLLPTGSLSLRWFAKLLRNTQRGLRGAKYLVVGRGHEPPEFLRQPDLTQIHYRQAQIEDVTFLARTEVAVAQRVVLLADLSAEDPDAATIQALLTITQSLREADAQTERQPKRARLLIAEVLDESNIPAARAAITGDANGRDSAQVRAFVVPSERLIALFVACNATRPGIGRLLEELLTSRGNELYTMFFDLPGLGYQRDSRPTLVDEPCGIMSELIQRARSLPSNKRVVPVGVLMADDEHIHVCVNPGAAGILATEAASEGASETEAPTDPVVPANPSPRCVGFVAIASSFGRVCELADDLYDRPPEQVPVVVPSAVALPSFVVSPTNGLGKILVCGFRSATVSMVEALIQSEPNTQILIMVASEAARESAWDDFDAHTKLVRRGLLGSPHGRFRADKDRWALTWRRPDDPNARSRQPHVQLVVGDWGSSRQLTSLPLGFGHVEKLDVVILISNERRGADARVAKTLMKLETLTQAPRIVAEVLDVELARRLRRRSAQQHDAGRVSVYSIQELRAFFMFQSVVVPSFDLVYAELMGPWGENFVRFELAPDAERTGSCSFEELGDHLALGSRVLIAVELCDRRGAHVHGPACETSLNVAAGSVEDDRIELERLTGVWVVARD